MFDFTENLQLGVEKSVENDRLNLFSGLKTMDMQARNTLIYQWL